MEVYTIGFTRRSAEKFFRALREAGIRVLLDVRLNNTSQLAGFTKKDDLAFFLRELCRADYRHEPSLAPTRELLEDYSGKRITWEEYERRFLALLEERRVADSLERGLFVNPGEKFYVSLAHSTEDVERTLDVFEAALDAVRD